MKSAVIFISLLALLATLLLGWQAGAAEPAPSETRYIVLLEDMSGTNGRSAAQARALRQQQQTRFLSQTAQTIGRFTTPRHQYSSLINGLTLTLTPEEAAQIAGLESVTAVFPDETHFLQSDAGPEWVNAPTVWAGVPGLGSSKGEGIVIGVLDTGINLDHPSFAAAGDDGYVHTNPLGSGTFLGHCATDPATYVCNDKTIGAYSWPDSGNNPDEGFHGSNVAAIVAGNIVSLTQTVPTTSMTLTFSGVAPHANLIAYDVCSETSCAVSVILAGLEQAFLDGVDVINYSIGGLARDPWQDPIALAMLRLREAGIFVAVSAGNDGASQGSGSILTPANAPWVTTVGNTTHHANLSNSLVDLSGGDTAPPTLGVGGSITSGFGPVSIVYAAGITNTDNVPDDGRCADGFPANTFSGEIVFCDRGGYDNSITAKAQQILNAGGGGLITTRDRTTLQRLGINRLALPGLELRKVDADALRTWLSSGGGHMATISGTTREKNPAYADVLYITSSLGPAPFSPNVLKPNVVAPGAKVWAAGGTSDPNNPPELAFYAGTSQSSPHVAGAAALLLALHPDWTPAQIESALMLTSETAVFQPDESTPATPLDSGAGRIDVAAAAQTGIVLDETTANFEAANPALGNLASQLNLASLTDASCVSQCQWTRTLHNPLDTATSWSASSSGLSLVVQPNSFTIPAGGSQTIRVTADVSGLTLDTWAFGEIRLTETTAVSPPAVNFPVTVLPTGSQLPSDLWEIDTRRNSGTAVWSDVQVDGVPNPVAQSTLRVTPTTSRQTLSSQPSANDPFVNLAQQTVVTFTVPTNAAGVWVALQNETVERLEIYLGRDDGDGVPESNETVCSRAGTAVFCADSAPISGPYWVMIRNVGEAEATVDLETAVVPNIAANSVTLENDALTYAWSEPLMSAGERQVGWLTIGSSAGAPADLASLPVLLERKEEGVTLTVDSADGIVTYTVSVADNVRPIGLTYTLTATVELLGEIVQEESWFVPVAALGDAISVEGSYAALFCGEQVTVTLTHITDNVGDEAQTEARTLPVACEQLFLPIIQR